MESKISFFPQEIVIAPLEYCFQSQNPDELREGAEGWWAGRVENLHQLPP